MHTLEELRALRKTIVDLSDAVAVVQPDIHNSLGLVERELVMIHWITIARKLTIVTLNNV
jgi:hypothetical protein